MKMLSTKLKDNWFWLCILGISFFGISFGLADLDYIWQRDLGEAIVTRFDFNACYEQIWGSVGIETYYDHEWLMNIIFYIFSLIPYKPLIWLKLTICFITGLQTIRFLKEFNFNYNKTFKACAVLVLYFLYILVFCKIKAYSISVLLFMEELILIERYKKVNYVKYIIRLGLICILWNNIHSGSMPLFFLVAGIYLLTCFRTKKLLVYGVVILLTTLINPYGYKMLLFNFRHNFDSIMKYIIQDWKGMDAKVSLGTLCTLLVIFFITLGIYQIRMNKTYIILGLVFVYMSMSSMRHIIYLFPILFLLVNYCVIDIGVNMEFLQGYLAIIILSVAVMGTITVITTYDYDEYSCNYVDDKLKSLIYDTIDEESTGLFNDHDYISMTEYNRKNFLTGAYPLNPYRYMDVGVMTRYGTESQIKSVIECYNLDKFIFNKYNSAVLYYKLFNPLYEYLRGSDEYECLYDSDKLVYFIRKEISS